MIQKTLIFALILTIFSCSSKKMDVKKTQNQKKMSLNKPKSEKEILQNNTWVWKSTYYNNDKKIFPKNKNAFVLTFKDGTMSSTTDCNTLFTPFSFVKNTHNFKFSKFASTLMACENSQENEYLKMLESVQYFMIKNNELHLLFKHDSGAMIFEKKTH